MKLRLRKNSVRFRLLQSEVEQLKNTGNVSETITLGLNPNEQFTYALRISYDSKKIFANIIDNRMEIALPNTVAEFWMNNDEEIGIYHTQNIDNSLKLTITIEKDFTCPTRPLDKDNKDAFPNPELNC